MQMSSETLNEDFNDYTDNTLFIIYTEGKNKVVSAQNRVVVRENQITFLRDNKIIIIKW